MRVLRPFAAIVFVAAAAWPQPLSGNIDDIAIDSQGNILVAVTDFYQVLKIAPDGTVSVFAGTGRQRDYWDPGGDGGPAVAAELHRASSVTVDPLTNQVYIADAIRVRKVDSNGIITTVVGNGNWGDGVARGEFAVEFALGHLRRIEFDPGSGKLYIAQQNGRIWRVENGRIYHHAGSGEEGCGGDGGPAAEAQFVYLIDLAVSSEGSVYLADPGNYRIHKIDPNGSTITAVVGNGRYRGYPIPDGTLALRTGIRRPHGLAFDFYNRLHFVAGYGLIYRLEEDGTLTPFSHLSYLLGESGGGRMVFDPVGNLILADNTRILEVSADGRRVRTIVDLESDVVSALRSAGPAKSELSEYQRKIIGGREVATGEWPFVAQVGDSSGLCTGSLVAPNWILTAAHCLRDHDGSVTDPSDISVFLGYDWDKGVCENTREEIGRVIIHPDYYSAGAGFRNDAALVEILRPAAADPIKILTPGDEAWLAPSGTTATVIGWGRQIDGSYPRVLRTVDIPLMTPEDCRENSFWTSEVVHERTLCAGVEGRGIWSGDSGGPLVVSLPNGDWGQVGVTSMGGRARAGYPGVFTRTSSIYDWIHEHIDERVQAKDPDEVQANVDAAVAAGGGLRAGGPPVTIDMSALFSFGDGGSADTTFTARSSHPAAVTADTTDGSLVLTPGDPAPVTITITVTATRGDDTAEVEFTVEFDTPLQAGDQIYYFPHLAVGQKWQTTITYINYSREEVTCQTDFISEHGSPLMVSFAGLGTVDSRTDVLPPGGSVHQETDVDLSAPLAPGWARATCSGPVKASLLYRLRNSEGAPTAEVGVNAAAVPATRFVTFAEQGEGQFGTGVAYANPSATSAHVTFTARDTAGEVLASVDRTLLPGGHDAHGMAELFDLTSFTGSIEVTSTEPIVSLSINLEAAPVFSSLPPGELDAAAQGSPTYYFPQLAVGASWQTTITYINYSSQEVTCQTNFLSDQGTPLMVSFAGLGTVDSRTDVLPPGGSVHQETDVDLSAPLAPGWARATCSGPVKASLLYRLRNSEGAPTAEVGVNAAAVPATRFVTFAEQGEGQFGTGVAYANPSATSAHVTFTARDTAGEVLASVDRTLLPGGHDAHGMAELFDLTSFTGSIEVTSTVPIVSLSINLEAAPVFSSLPPGELDAATPAPPPEPSPTRPPNDLFSNARTISGPSGRVTGSNVGATDETGEPEFRSSSSSVWWQWRAPSSGRVTIDTIGSSFDTTLGVYTGTRVDTLTTLGENDDAVEFGGASRVTLTVTAGTVYRLRVAGFFGDEGSIVLNWNPQTGL